MSRSQLRCRHQFRETAHAALRASPDPDVLHVGSFIWCRPYVGLCPEWCYVLDDGNGEVVGYILCAPDTPEFVERFKTEFMSVLKAQVREVSPNDDQHSQVSRLRKDAFNPDIMLISDYPDLVRQYPAHLHIDILTSHQNQRWGEKLIETLLDRLAKGNVTGIHLGMAFDNDGAGRFYQRMGFQPIGEMNERGKPGSRGGAIYVCRKVS